MRLLPLPELRCRTSAESNVIDLSDAGTFAPHIYIDRHHSGGCAPYWVATEQRRDEMGRLWRAENVYMVPDEYGDLQEVLR